MKKYGGLATVLLIWMFLGAAPAWGFQQLTGNGDIVVNVKSETGNGYQGGKGHPDAAHHQRPRSQPDAIVFASDGFTDEDGVSPDGDVEFKKSTIGPFVSSGQIYRVTVEVAGYIAWTGLFTYTDQSTNIVSSSNMFTVKIVAMDELGNIVPNMNVAIAGGQTVRDNGTGDGSSTLGVLYIAQDPTGLTNARHGKFHSGRLRHAARQHPGHQQQFPNGIRHIHAIRFCHNRHGRAQ